jgi:hypothetical protein
MTLKLTRGAAFIISLVVLIVIFASNRINFLIGSNYARGYIINMKPEQINYLELENSLHAFIYKAADDSTYQVFDRSNSWVTAGDSVNVVYKESNPFKAKIFSFSGFWMPKFDLGIFTAIVLVLTIFFYSFFPKKSNIFFNFGKQKK